MGFGRKAIRDQDKGEWVGDHGAERMETVGRGRGKRRETAEDETGPGRAPPPPPKRPAPARGGEKDASSGAAAPLQRASRSGGRGGAPLFLLPLPLPLGFSPLQQFSLIMQHTADPPCTKPGPPAQRPQRSCLFGVPGVFFRLQNLLPDLMLSLWFPRCANKILATST